MSRRASFRNRFALGARSLIWLLLVIGVGCTSTRISVDQLPEAPIALMHWEDKASTSRAESFEKAAELPRPPEDREFPERAEQQAERIYLRAEQSPQLARRLSKHPGRLVLLWPRTGKVERIEAAPPGSRPLAWSKDRKTLLFSSSHREGREQLYEYHVEREDLSVVTVGPDEHPRGDYDENGRLVIARLRRPDRSGVSQESVWLARPGGRFEAEVARGVPPGTLRTTPSRDRIVYEQVRPRPRRDGPTIFESFVATRATAPDSEEQILLKGREPALTPDGDWIVFASASSAGYRLRRMRLDGSSRVPIGFGGPAGVDERMPSVSPDGEFVAFIRETAGRRRLIVRRFDGRDERPLLVGGWSEFPVW